METTLAELAAVRRFHTNPVNNIPSVRIWYENLAAMRISERLPLSQFPRPTAPAMSLRAFGNFSRAS